MYQSHRSRRAVKAVAAALALAAALACEGEGGVKSDRPPADRQVDTTTQRTATIRAEGSGPYQVYVRASRVGDARGDHTRKTVAGGAYKQTLDYSSGLRIEITITVTGNSRDIFSCEISDGTHRSRERRAGQARCQLTTSR